MCCALVRSKLLLLQLAASILLVLATQSTELARAQQLSATRPWSENVIVPQTYRNAIAVGANGYGLSGGMGGVGGVGSTIATDASQRLQLRLIDVSIDVRDQIAETKLLFTIHNPTKHGQTAELLIPVANGSVIRSFTFNGAASEPDTELLESDKAKQIFQSIVAKLRDPALLEFAGFNMVRSSVFPVPAGGEQKVQLVLEQLLTNDNHRVDYLLPRSPSQSSDVPWKLTAKVKSTSKIATVYSPSHQIAVQRVSDYESTLSVPENAAAPGAFRFSYLQSTGPLTASLMTSPDTGGKSGHFLLLAGLAQDGDAKKAAATKTRREITLILDRSGSMNGQKIEQAKQAALQVISGLDMGEAFNIITFNSRIDQFSQKPVIKSADSEQRAIEFIQAVTATEGTNIHDALMTGLAPEVSEGCLPIVLFLTDGLATVGNTAEAAIREVAEKHNKFNRRIFSFGVGFDVNTPLLDKLATSTRGFATFVTPGENVEAAVAKVYRGLNGPTLSDLKLMIADQPSNMPSRIHELMPDRLPDLYEGDQLVVLGSYRGDKPLKFEITAKRGDRPVTFQFEFDPTQNQGQAFVSRLWASRKIASLIDQVRDMGANQSSANSQKLVSSKAGAGNAAEVKLDPKLVELTDSIVALSKKYGILTEYTSFLATEGIDLSDSENVKKLLSSNLVDRAVMCRTGQASWNQEINNGSLRGQTSLNLENRYVNQAGKWVSTTTIQQCRGNALYNRSGRWVEAGLIEKSKVEPDRVVEFGSPEFLELLWKMVALGRQDELAVEGEILITVDGKATLIRGLTVAPAPEAAAQEASSNQASQK